MCDTFVALPEATANGAVLLAKSADTEINEAQHVLKLPRRDYPEGAMVRLTHLVIPQARHTHEVLLDKSFWLYGGEIGVNEQGVAIGNEAVFSNLASEKDGVILIDLLRLMLERASDRHEAVELTAQLLAGFGQGGNCELRGNSHFDGSFIVSDKTGAVVLETAGKEWAAKEVKGFASISNGYTIRDDWDLSSLKPRTAARPISPPGSAMRKRPAARRRGSGRRPPMISSPAMPERSASGPWPISCATPARRTDYEPMQGERPTRVCMHAAPMSTASGRRRAL
jgi:Dipeptidase